MFETRTIEDLVRIAAAGGGFKIDASLKSTDDLVRIAAAASTKQAKIALTGLKTRTTEDLVRIGAAGKGCVFFED
jgi:DNA replication protein